MTLKLQKLVSPCSSVSYILHLSLEMLGSLFFVALVFLPAAFFIMLGDLDLSELVFFLATGDLDLSELDDFLLLGLTDFFFLLLFGFLDIFLVFIRFV